MRVAMVGLGDIAQKAYMPVVANHVDITPIACTRNPVVLERLKRQYRINETYDDLDALIVARPDIVMVHSSTDSHHSIVKKCLTANIPVFVDKPISYHYRECAELIELAAKKQLPLLVGFNRRFAPLYQLFRHVNARQVHYQKNRLERPATAREFVFDDFIHVLDFVRFCTPGEPEDLEVFSQSSAGLLHNLQVQWQHDGALFTAGMNRMHGRAEEQLRYIGLNEYWEINNLASGCHYKEGQQHQLDFGDWEPTLAKRGFVGMVDDMLEVISKGQTTQQYEDILATHALCEDLVSRIESTSVAR